MTGAPRVSILRPDPEEVRPRGAVSSVQEAEIVVGRDVLDRIWGPDNLELLARAYWAFLRRMSLGVIRVHYSATARTVTAFGRIPLLRFGTPLYETGEGHGRVTWPIESGILVAREGRGRGSLRVSVERLDRDGADSASGRVRLIARVEVESFYPGLRGRGRFSRFGARLYEQTQLRIHVLVCNAYLRSLPRLDFPAIDRSGLPSGAA
ncbi:MAG: hypothetical protein EDQ89_10095 [Acidobacteria bacterium]|nr:MAG: hypothetical protein EDQ89_10095 [Acidobacteriota bacterium]GIK76608.1 MAG: hypothetical protein BroJett022_02980 [Actinomycetes bacterium]